MSFSHEYNFPVFIGTGSVLTSGTSADLGKGQLGIFNAKTAAALSPVAGAVSPQLPLFIAAGSLHTKNKLDKYTGGLLQSDKTIEFTTRGILSFEKSKPRKAQSEQWVIGWDGLDQTSLAFEAGKTYRYQIKVWGEDVYGTFLRPIQKEVSITTGCLNTSNCEDGNCSDPVDPKYWAYEIKKAIESDPELKYFVQADVISSDYAATSATHRLYNLTICDTGDQLALAAVQGAYPTKTVERIDRRGTLSTYQFCDAITNDAPADFTPTSDILLAECGTCPSGYTTVAARDRYVVTRALLPTTDLNSSADQDTYAGTIVTAYSAISGTGKFLSFDGATAKVEFQIAAGTAVTAINSDLVFKAGTIEAYCTPPAGTAISWVASGDRYKITRTKYVTLQKVCGTNNRLTELQAFYANDPTVVADSISIVTSGPCNDKYQIQQYSNECSIDACLSKPVPTFDNLQTFEGMMWEDAPLSDPTEDQLAVKVGIVLTAAYEGDSFGGCSFQPQDYYSVRPLKLEVTEFTGIGTLHFDGDGNPCKTLTKTRKIRNSSMPTQSGEYIIREFIKGNVYRAHGEFHYDPRLREVLDSVAIDVVDRNKAYVTYHLKVIQNRMYQNHLGDFSPEVYEFMFAFPEGASTSAFEVLVENVTSQNGVFLQDR